MAAVLASKFIYSMEEIEKVLEPFKGMAVQLAFFRHSDFHKFDHGIIKKVLREYNISVPTVHAPTIDVFDDDFICILMTIKQEYNVSVITIHPQHGDKERALEKLKELKDKIEKAGIVLAYENFPASQKKWINSPVDMYKLFDQPYLRLTYDLSHRDLGFPIAKEIDEMIDKIEVVHLSDIKVKGNEIIEHQPIGSGILPINDALKVLARKKFNGYVVLEYMPEYEHLLREDVKKVESLFQSV